MLLCDLKPGDNDTIEVTIFSEAAVDAARELGEALSRPLGRPLALASVLEVKVETALLTDPDPAGVSGTGYLAVLGCTLVVILLIVVLFGIWYLKYQARRRSGLTATTSSETSLHRHRSDMDEKSNNLQNEENLRRYTNPLKEAESGEPRVSIVRPLSSGSLGPLGALGLEESLEMVTDDRHRLPPLYKPPCTDLRNSGSFSFDDGPHKPYCKPRMQDPPAYTHQPGPSQSPNGLPNQQVLTVHV